MSSAPRIATHIKPNNKWVKLNIRELWQHRDLIYVLVARDFSSRFRQTILGPVWYVFQPLLITLVFTFVFGQVLGVSTDGIPSNLFYLSGLICWNYFSQTMAAAGNSFHTNAAILTKVYFPRLVLPIATGISGLVGMVVQLTTLLIFFGINWWQNGQPPLSDSYSFSHTLLFPVIVLQTMMLATGVSLWTSAVSAKYRDFQHVLPLVTQLWMYLTPIAYPLSKVPEKWVWLAKLNPMTTPVELTRLCFFGSSTIDITMIIGSVLTSIVILGTGIFAFQRMERTFADLA